MKGKRETKAAARMRAMRRRRAIAAASVAQASSPAIVAANVAPGDHPVRDFLDATLAWCEVDRSYQAGKLAGKAADLRERLSDRPWQPNVLTLSERINYEVLRDRLGEIRGGTAEPSAIRAGLSAAQILMNKPARFDYAGILGLPPETPWEDAQRTWVLALSGGLHGRAGVPEHVFVDVDSPEPDMDRLMADAADSAYSLDDDGNWVKNDKAGSPAKGTDQ